MATLYSNGIMARPRRSHKGMRHLADTYRCINRDFRENYLPTDPTVAVIVSLAVHENLTDQYGVGKIHLHAIRSLLEPRGGIEGLSTNWVLWHKVCRADLDRAFHQGSETLFYQDCLPLRASQDMAAALWPRGRVIDKLGTVDVSPGLEAIIIDMHRFCTLLNEQPKVFQHTPSTCQGSLILFGYRLLHTRPLATTSYSGSMDDVMHAALLAFLTAALLDRNRQHESPFELLADRITDAMSDLLPKSQLSQQPALLWVLFISGISLYDAQDAFWLKTCIRSCLSALHVETWTDARSILSRLPWIHVLHDKPACKLCGKKLWTTIPQVDCTNRALRQQKHKRIMTVAFSRCSSPTIFGTFPVYTFSS